MGGRTPSELDMTFVPSHLRPAVVVPVGDARCRLERGLAQTRAVADFGDFLGSRKDAPWVVAGGGTQSLSRAIHQGKCRDGPGLHVDGSRSVSGSEQVGRMDLFAC